MVGFNYRADPLQAKFLLIKLKYLQRWTNLRIKILIFIKHLKYKTSISFVKQEKF